MSFFADTRHTGKSLLVERTRPSPEFALTIDQSLQWFVFKVAQQHERKAKEAIQKLGHKAVVPMALKFRRVGRTRRKKFLPTVVFPRYIFVGFQPGPVPFREVLTLPMVRGVVAPGGHPSRLDAAHLNDWLKERDFAPDSILKLVANRTSHPVMIDSKDRAA